MQLQKERVEQRQRNFWARSLKDKLVANSKSSAALQAFYIPHLCLCLSMYFFPVDDMLILISCWVRCRSRYIARNNTGSPGATTQQHWFAQSWQRVIQKSFRGFRIPISVPVPEFWLISLWDYKSCRYYLHSSSSGRWRTTHSSLIRQIYLFIAASQLSFLFDYKFPYNSLIWLKRCTTCNNSSIH